MDTSSAIPHSRHSWLRCQPAVSDLQSQAVQALTTVLCSMSNADKAVSQVNEFYLIYTIQARYPPKWHQLLLVLFDVNKNFLSEFILLQCPTFKLQKFIRCFEKHTSTF